MRIVGGKSDPEEKKMEVGELSRSISRSPSCLLGDRDGCPSPLLLMEVSLWLLGLPAKESKLEIRMFSWFP